jgi:hypothetical protein
MSLKASWLGSAISRDGIGDDNLADVVPAFMFDFEARIEMYSSFKVLGGRGIL